MHSRLPTIADIDLLLAKARQECAPVKVLKRLECIRLFCAGGKSVTLLCREFGIARGTFYRMMRLVDMQACLSGRQDWRTLLDASRRPTSTRSTALEPKIAALIREYRSTHAMSGKRVIKQLLQSQHGISVSVSAIGRLIKREKLFFGNSLLHQRKRVENTSPTPPSIPDTPTNAQETRPLVMLTVRRWMTSLLSIVGFGLVLMLAIGALWQAFGIPSSLIELMPMHAAAEEGAPSPSLDDNDLRTPGVRVRGKSDSRHKP